MAFRAECESVELNFLVAHHPDGRLSAHDLLELEPDVGSSGLVTILKKAAPLVLAHAQPPVHGVVAKWYIH